jgi:phospholipid/cholesterol/gamma-HCH transport system ATP-binding protein
MNLFHHKDPARDDEHQHALLMIEQVSKAFDHPVLEKVSMEVRKGETVAVLGKSGTGKSVLLKLVVGLLEPDAGEIYFEGKEVTHLTEEGLVKLRKKIGFLFQGAALFDSMTVGENLDMFLIKHTKLPRDERESKIQRALEVVGLKNVIDKMPSDLSGGMKKRAGLARSIVIEPELMLYDEPTTGLDPVTASSIADLILSLQQDLGIASIVVTHDLPTAFAVSDRAIVLNKGHKIFDDKIEELSKNDDPFLREYLTASRLERRTHEPDIHLTHPA